MKKEGVIMFDNEIRNLYNELQNDLKQKSETSLTNVNEIINSTRNNIIERVSNMITSHGIQIDSYLIEQIVDESLVNGLKDSVKTSLNNNYQTLSKFNNAINSSIMEQARKPITKSEKENQINLVMDKFNYTMGEYKKSNINLLEQYNNLFQTILRKISLYENSELVEDIKNYLTSEKESMEQYFQEQRNKIISSNLDKLVLEQQHLVKNTDLVSVINSNNHVVASEVQTKEESYINTNATQIEKKIKLGDVDLNEGYYHFTNASNVESILTNGLEARIGTASKMVNDRPNVSISQGGKGVFGIVNSFIFVLSKKQINEIPEEFKKYFEDITDFTSTEKVSRDSVCKAIINKLKDEAYIYIDLDEGTLENARIGGLSGFDINLPMGIESSRLKVITDENGNILSSYDIVSYMFEKVKNNNVWREFNEDLFYMMEMASLEKNTTSQIENEIKDNEAIIDKSQENQEVHLQSIEENFEKNLEAPSLKSDERTISNESEYDELLNQLDSNNGISQEDILIQTSINSINSNIWNDIGIMSANTDTQINQLSEQSLNTIMQILSNNGTQYNPGIIKKVCIELNQQLRELNNNLSTNMIKSFSKINEETLKSIQQSFNRPDEIQEMDVEQCKQVYFESTNLSSFQLTCHKEFQLAIDSISQSLGISPSSQIYNELITNLENIRSQMETNFYNMYSSFSHNNAVFMDKAISSVVLSQKTMVDMNEELSQEQISRLLSYCYEDYEKEKQEEQGFTR